MLELLKSTLKFPSVIRGSLIVSTHEIKVASYHLGQEIPRVMIGLPIVIKLIINLASSAGRYYFTEKFKISAFCQRCSLTYSISSHLGSKVLSIIR